MMQTGGPEALFQQPWIRVGKTLGLRKVFFKLREIHSNRHYNRAGQAIAPWPSSRRKIKKIGWGHQTKVLKLNQSQSRTTKLFQDRLSHQWWRPLIIQTAIFILSKLPKFHRSKALKDQELLKILIWTTHLSVLFPHSSNQVWAKAKAEWAFKIHKIKSRRRIGNQCWWKAIITERVLWLWTNWFSRSYLQQAWSPRSQSANLCQCSNSRSRSQTASLSSMRPSYRPLCRRWNLAAKIGSKNTRPS